MRDTSSATEATVRNQAKVLVLVGNDMKTQLEINFKNWNQGIPAGIFPANH